MITPAFTVEQDHNSVTIKINSPHVRAQDVDLFVDGSEFKFYLKPYFLRLQLPGNICEDEQSTANYDISTGIFTIKVTKETPGEHFEDLDLLTKLLARRGEQKSGETATKKPLIEVISSTTETQDIIQDAEEFDWQLPQELPTEELLTSTTTYGFNSQYNGYFTYVAETANEINCVQNPEKSTAESRREDRVNEENAKFDEDYYVNDFVNTEEIDHIIKFKTSWWKELRRIQKKASAEQKQSKVQLIQEVRPESNSDIPDLSMGGLEINDYSQSLIEFTEKENVMMRTLPNKEYLLSNEKSIYLGLIDLLFAYSYNHRQTEGEDTVESVWTIGKLSPSIAGLEKFTTLQETLISCYRRALAFPLYRNYNLCDKILQDIYILLKLGKRAVLKALLEMKDMFDHHDIYYIYSKIWLDDYCIWIQQSSGNVLKTLAHELHHFQLPKALMDLDLEELEEIARDMMQNADIQQVE
ncbi:SHQ1 protein-domain-containing protein [Umbelopsis sp. PMI_123]|nr:SHQ1 protein-domain-containing protein [Umbelopsis sp. PMI_123]